MNVFNSSEEIQHYLLNLRLKGNRIALVPTMGNLHEGHLSLIRLASQNADVVVVSIFVNPTQFSPNEDFSAYPRTFEADCAKIQACMTKEFVIFAPTEARLYADDFSTWVEETKLSKPLCGVSRPIHFRGVTTVVAKLFNICQPQIAVFGQKDAQQAFVIKRMVRDLNFPIEILVAPIVRDSDGLALSSRNQYLTPQERKNALCMSALLADIKKNTPYDLKALCTHLVSVFSDHGGRVDYVQTVSTTTLEVVETLDTETLLAIAVYFGKTRLIDNLILEPKHA